MRVARRTSRPDTATRSLFEGTDTEDRLRRWLRAFDDQVRARAALASTHRPQRPWREASESVYREMWEALAGWCTQRAIDLADLTGDDLEAFVASRGATGDLSTRYAWRLLWLVDLIERHAAGVEGRAPNRAARELLASPRYRYANTAEHEPSLDYLSARETRTLIAHLTDNGGPGLPAPAAGAKRAWTDVRDRTAVALQLGAGITPGEIRALRLADVVVEGGVARGVPWKLAVPANGNHPARETPVSTWAGRQLAWWLRVRAATGIGGDLLFPSTAQGRPWSRTQVYTSCQQVLERAGVATPRGGTYRLRHTFALRQLARGKSEADVAAWLGLQEPATIERYRRVVSSPVSDLV